MKELSTLEQLCFCTTRIEATSPNGHKYYGTGFFYMFPLEEEGKCLIYLVTNRHLAQNMKEIKLNVNGMVCSCLQYARCHFVSSQ